MFYKCFDKKTKGSGVTTLTNNSAIKSIPQNEQLADELQKPIIRKFRKRKVYSAFKDNIWAADLVDMQLISKFNRGLDFYYVLLIFLANMGGLFFCKDKKVLSIVNAFQKILKTSARKSHKI